MDPLDAFVRRVAGRVPVPAALGRRRRRAWPFAIAAAAALLAGLVAFWPRAPKPPDPVVAGPVLRLDASPAPVDLAGIAFTADVRSTADGLVFRFEE
jgi:hypothetical protein